MFIVNKKGLKNLNNILCVASFDREILVWGASYKADEIVKQLSEWGVSIHGYIDRNESIRSFRGKKVFGADILKEKKWYVYVALMDQYQEVTDALKKYGYEEFDDYWYPGRLVELDGTGNYEDLYGNCLKTKNETPVTVRLRQGGTIIINSKTLEPSLQIVSVGDSRVFLDKGVRVGRDVVCSSTNGSITIEENVQLESNIVLRASAGGSIHLGKGTTIQRHGALVCSFHAKVVFGEDCMLSYYVSVRAGNSHNMIDLKTGVHFDDNDNRNVILGKHVWIGMGTTLLNGVRIGSGSMVGANSFVCKKTFGSNCCVAGNPAKIMREKIAWMREGVFMIKDVEPYRDFIYEAQEFDEDTGEMT